RGEIEVRKLLVHSEMIAEPPGYEMHIISRGYPKSFIKIESDPVVFPFPKDSDVSGDKKFCTNLSVHPYPCIALTGFKPLLCDVYSRKEYPRPESDIRLQSPVRITEHEINRGSHQDP